MLADLQYILDRAESIAAMVDHLWKVDSVVLNLLSPVQSSKEARRLRQEEFVNALDAKLTAACRKQMFDFKDTGLEDVDTIFSRQWVELTEKLQRMKKNSRKQQGEGPVLLRGALKVAASTWDHNVGRVGFGKFLAAGQELANKVLHEWVNKAFMSSARRSQAAAGPVFDSTSAVSTARGSLKKHLQDAVTRRINDSR